VDVVTLDPHLSGSKFDRQVYHNLYDPLFILDEKLGIQPNLVESYQTPDPQTLILKLRSGLKFHDGTPLDADAVVFSLDRQRDKKPPHPFHAVGGPYTYWQSMSMDDIVKDIRGADDSTVVPWQESHAGDEQQRGIQGLRAVILGEGVALGVIAVRADVGVDLIA